MRLTDSGSTDSRSTDDTSTSTVLVGRRSPVRSTFKALSLADQIRLAITSGFPSATSACSWGVK